MTLPENFIKNMEEQLGGDAESFFKAIDGEASVSVRLNPKKEVLGIFSENIDKQVPWTQNGFYLKQKPVFALDPLFYSGAYQVQDASAMFLEFALKATVDLKRPLRVLDMCAAPGATSTLLASLLKPNDLLVVNEVIKSRLTVLKENLLKWGFPNVIVTNQDPETFSDLEGFFDIVLVDAPSSAEGVFKKDPNAINSWSEQNIQMCATRQKRILSAAGLLVAPRGHLIYTTNAYNSEENSKNVKWLTRTLDFVQAELEVPAEWNIEKVDGGYQFYPHKTQGEGFFFSIFNQMSFEEGFNVSRLKLNALRKSQVALLAPWINSEVFEDFSYFAKTDGVVIALYTKLQNDYATVFNTIVKRSSGFEIGIFKGSDFIPSHGLALSPLVSDSITKVELNAEDAISFLRKENFEVDTFENGWVLVCHKGLALGWVKKIGDRINNYLPAEWRLKMDVE